MSIGKAKLNSCRPNVGLCRGEKIAFRTRYVMNNNRVNSKKIVVTTPDKKICVIFTAVSTEREPGKLSEIQSFFVGEDTHLVEICPLHFCCVSMFQVLGWRPPSCWLWDFLTQKLLPFRSWSSLWVSVDLLSQVRDVINKFAVYQPNNSPGT